MSNEHMPGQRAGKTCEILSTLLGSAQSSAAPHMSGQVKKIDTDSRQLQLTTSTDNIRTDNVEFQITELGNDTREMENYEEYNDRCQVITHSTIKHLQKKQVERQALLENIDS